MVVAVNELFHDLEGRSYQSHHPEIFDMEADRWRRACEQFVEPFSGPKRLLDVGSGTGFVPMQLRPFLGRDDLLICSDLSAGMLDACRRNIEQTSFACKTDFVI